MDQDHASSSPRIAIIKARWHADIVDRAHGTFLDEISSLTSGTATVESFDVPGAFEIPLLSKDLARSGRFDAIVGIAFVVDGGIYRHDFVASTVVDALMRVQLETDVAVFSVVLTPHAYQETEAHDRFFLDHFEIKGREAARACDSFLKTRSRIRAGV